MESVVGPAVEDICLASAAVLLGAGPQLRDIEIDLFHISYTARERSGNRDSRSDKTVRKSRLTVSASFKYCVYIELILRTPMETPKIGTRISLAGSLGTIKFAGYVDNTNGLWLGVEWDDPQRGKHSGMKDGKQYFQCR